MTEPGIFDPYTAGLGTFPISYSVSNLLGCTTIVTQAITVFNRNNADVCILTNSVPSVSFTGLQPSYCLADQVLTLNGIPPGGIFSGPGIAGNTFTPSVAGKSSSGHVISYNITDAHGCKNYTTQVVIVNNPCSRSRYL